MVAAFMLLPCPLSLSVNWIYITRAWPHPSYLSSIELPMYRLIQFWSSPMIPSSLSLLHTMGLSMSGMSNYRLLNYGVVEYVIRPSQCAFWNLYYLKPRKQKKCESSNKCSPVALTFPERRWWKHIEIHRVLSRKTVIAFILWNVFIMEPSSSNPAPAHGVESTEVAKFQKREEVATLDHQLWQLLHHQTGDAE